MQNKGKHRTKGKPINESETTEVKHKKTVPLLSKGEEYYQTLFDTIPHGIQEIDVLGKIIFVNKAYNKIFGYEEGGAIGESILDKLLNDSERKKLRDYLKTLITDQPIPIPYFEKNRTKEGRIIEVQVDWNYKRDKKGNVVGFISVISDITKRKQAEMKLTETRDYLENIIESSLDGIVVSDNNGYILRANMAFLNMLGYKEEEVIGKHLIECSPLEEGNYTSTTGEPIQINDAYFKSTKTDMATFLHEGKVVNRKTFYLTKDKKLIPAEDNLVFLFDTKGNRIGSVAVIRNITERKMAEVALLESEERYKGLVNNIGIGVSLISPNMEILSLNNQMQQWFPEADVSKKPICYKTFNNPPKERVCSYCPTFKTLQDGQVHESITDTPQDDKILHYRIISSPLKDKKGKITSAIEMVEDITEQKVAQEKLLYYQKQLKTLASQITLTEEKERKRFAEYLHDEIGQHLFASQIQLGQLKGALGATEYAKSLDDVINNLKQIIDKSRSLTFEISSPILYELGLEKALEWLVENIYKQYNLVITLANDDQEKPLDDDIKMFLYQAVRELLTNVAKHAQTQNAIVSIKKENSNIQICVKDNGVGFDPSQEYSLNNSNNRFGLFHISERIEQFGGQIEIESQPNRGTQITLVAPLKNSV